MCRELEAVTYSEYGERMVERASPLVADISSDFSRCLHTFQQQTQVHTQDQQCVVHTAVVCFAVYCKLYGI